MLRAVDPTTIVVVLTTALPILITVLIFFSVARFVRRAFTSVGFDRPAFRSSLRQVRSARSLLKTLGEASGGNALAQTDQGREALAGVVEQLRTAGLNLNPARLAQAVLVPGAETAAQFRGGEEVDERRVRAGGTRGRARIERFHDLGIAVGESQVVELELKVTLPGQEPYPVKLNALVPRTTLGRIVRGQGVAVVVDPKDREHLVVDWLG